MERWSGKVAIVTGASAGIGAIIATDLAMQGLKVVALARRTDKLKALEEEMSYNERILKGLECDLTKEEDIRRVFQWVEDNWGPVDVLVNNAALLIPGRLQDAEYNEMGQMFNTNIVAMSFCAKMAIKSMKAHGVKNGHIININSVAGHSILSLPNMAGYTATKHSMTVLTTCLKNELAADKSGIRVTSLSPGSVKSQMSDDFLRNMEKKPPILPAQEVSRALIFVLSAPPNVNISELTIEAI